MIMRTLPGTIVFLCFTLIACESRDATNSAPGGSNQSNVGSPNVEVSVRGLEQNWADAVRTRDSATLERLVAPDFTVSSESSTDAPLPRALWMTNTLHNLRVDSIRLSPARVVLKGDTATATLEFFWAGQFKSTPPFRDSTVLTDTWILDRGAWQVHRRVLVK